MVRAAWKASLKRLLTRALWDVPNNEEAAMAKTSNSSSGGIGVIGLLGVAFVVLKLCGVIEWSWWWVTAPFWGGFAVLAAVLLSVWAAVLWKTR